MPETASLFVQVADAVGAFLRVAHNPDVLHHVVHVHCRVGHFGVNLGGTEQAGTLPVGQLMLDVIASQDGPGPFARQFRGSGHKHVPADSPVPAAAILACLGRAFLHHGPVVPQVLGRQVGAAHGNPTPLAGDADGAGRQRGGSHADGRMGLLVRLHVQAPFHHRVQLRRIHLEILAVVGELALGLPYLQDDVQSLRGTFPNVNARIRPHAEQGQVGGDGAVADAPIDTPV